MYTIFFFYDRNKTVASDLELVHIRDLNDIRAWYAGSCRQFIYMYYHYSSATVLLLSSTVLSMVSYGLALVLLKEKRFISMKRDDSYILEIFMTSI